MVWKMNKNGLIHATDENRINIKTRIFAKDLEILERIAGERETTVSYLLENGLENMFKKDDIVYDSKTRNKAKEYFKGNIDKELVNKVKEEAEKNKVKITSVFCEAVHHIELDKVKHKSWAYRIE